MFVPASIAAASALAQEEAPLPVEVVAELASIGEVALSPDGRRVAWVELQPDPQASYDGSLDVDNAYLATLWLTEVRTGRTIRVGPTNLDTFDPSWSPDGARLAFKAGRGERERLWIWSADTQEVGRIEDLIPRRRSSPTRWTPDSRKLLIAVLPKDLTHAMVLERMGAGEGAAYPFDTTTPGASVAVYRFPLPSAENPPAAGRQDFASNNAWIADLAVVDVETQKYERLVSGYRPVDYRISPDGRQVAMAHIAGQEAGSGYRNLFDVVMVDINSGSVTPIAQDVPQIGVGMATSWAPDGRHLAFFDSGPGAKGDCHVISVPQGGRRTVARGAFVARSGATAPVWDARSANFYMASPQGLWRTRLADLRSEIVPVPEGFRLLEVVTNRFTGTAASPDGTRLIVRLRESATHADGFYAFHPSTGQARRLYGGNRRIDGSHIDVSSDATMLAYTEQGADVPPQLWVSDTAFHQRRRICDPNSRLREYRLGASRLVNWRGLDGERLYGALLLPPRDEPAGPYPLVVKLYGGSRLSNDLNVFGFNDHAIAPYNNMQLLATRGYAVLLADTQTRPGTPMRAIADTLLPGVNLLVEEGIADPDRLGLIGHSFGGYSVLAVLVQSNRFKAAIEFAGLGNLLDVYTVMNPDGASWGISLMEEGQGLMGGSVWEHRDRYIENSPFFYFDRITTPLLVVHGADDEGVRSHQADAIFQALRRLGKTVEYAKYLGESHIIIRRPNAIDYTRRMLGWYERYLCPDRHSATRCTH